MTNIQTKNTIKENTFVFKPESWQSHDEYRTIVDTYSRRPSRNNPKYFFDLYDKERRKLLELIPSMELGLVNPKKLTISDDGTAVVSHASPYGRHLSSREHSRPFWDTCGRHNSAPDAE